jgi:hypothetical protein
VAVGCAGTMNDKGFFFRVLGHSRPWPVESVKRDLPAIWCEFASHQFQSHGRHLLRVAGGCAGRRGTSQARGCPHRQAPSSVPWMNCQTTLVDTNRGPSKEALNPARSSPRPDTFSAPPPLAGARAARNGKRSQSRRSCALQRAPLGAGGARVIHRAWLRAGGSGALAVVRSGGGRREPLGKNFWFMGGGCFQTSRRARCWSRCRCPVGHRG